VLLEHKNAVIYGGGGSIGGAVARAFAREGANVFLAGRTRAKLDAVADEVRARGGAVATAEVDALDERAVLISHGDVQGTPMAEMALEDYERPVVTAVRTMFLTTRAAARHMIRQGSGAILVFGGEGDPPRGYNLGGLQTAFHAMEAMRRQLSSELGPHGVRVVTLRTGGVPESIPESFAGRDAITESIEQASMLGRAATLEDVGHAAAFAASDRARAMTAATINVSAGTLID
jgi:3-oxoacyl-[acyl-carrier protein] reductase